MGNGLASKLDPTFCVGRTAVFDALRACVQSKAPRRASSTATAFCLRGSIWQAMPSPSADTDATDVYRMAGWYNSGDGARADVGRVPGVARDARELARLRPVINALAIGYRRPCGPAATFLPRGCQTRPAADTDEEGPPCVSARTRKHCA